MLEGGCCRTEGRTKSVFLTFKRAELLYDAANSAYVEGDIMQPENEDARHQVHDIAEFGNVDRATRVLTLAHSECIEALYPFAKEEIPDALLSLDDKLIAPEEYRITLILPEAFSMTTVRLLENLIHEYLVCRVLADWMSVVKPESMENWAHKAQAALSGIQGSLLWRRGRMHRKLKPF